MTESLTDATRVPRTSDHPTDPPGGTVPPGPDIPRTADVPPPHGAVAAARISRDPLWSRIALAVLLLGTTIGYLINLGANGWANSFYSAAVQAGSQSWEAFFFGSLDSANAITVDKPPGSLWVMAASVRIFGLNSWAILVPEVLMAVAAVAVLHLTVKRAFGAGAGLIAGAALALTPVAALMFRFNNPDALLTLLMTLAAWATMRAVDFQRVRAALRWMMLAGVFIGFAFLTKTLQAFLVLPALALVWLVAGRTTILKRIGVGLAAVAAMVVSAGWWVAIVELTPASMRPYIGGSQNNSFLELTFGYNGLGRLNGNETGSVGGGGGGGGRWGEAGLLRMFTGQVGGQISWLIPAALILLIAGLLLRGRAPRTDLRRAGYLLWGGWLLVTGLTFSFMAGIFHEYYTVALAPAIAALIGMGAAEAWQRRDTAIGRIALAAASVVTGVWGNVLLSQTTAYPAALRSAVLVAGVAAGVALLAVHRFRSTLAAVVASVALIAGVAGPTAFTVTTISEAHSGSIVTAGPTVSGGRGGLGGGPGGPGGTAGTGGMRGAPNTQAGRPAQGMGNGGPQGGFGQSQNGTGGGTGDGRTGSRGGGTNGLLNASAPSAEVIARLTENSSQYTWVASSVGSQNAAGVQLATQLPVMAVGGFNGSDPSPTLAQFEAYVQAGKIHYFIGGSLGGQQNGGSEAASEIVQWVQQNFTQVTVGSTTMYDLTQPLTGSSSSGTSTTQGA